MPATELALLKLKGEIPDDARLQSDLADVKTAAAIGDDTLLAWYRQVEDPSNIYMILAPISEDNQTKDARLQALDDILISSFGHLFELQWTIQLAVEHSTLPLHAAVMAIGRHFVQPGKTDEFDATYSQVKHLPENFSPNRGLTGGWRVDTEQDHEWVQFSGWDAVSEHRKFPTSDGFKEYAVIRSLVTAVEVRHAIPFGRRDTCEA